MRRADRFRDNFCSQREGRQYSHSGWTLESKENNDYGDRRRFDSENRSRSKYSCSQFEYGEERKNNRDRSFNGRRISHQPSFRRDNSGRNPSFRNRGGW